VPTVSVRVATAVGVHVDHVTAVAGQFQADTITRWRSVGQGLDSLATGSNCDPKGGLLPDDPVDGAVEVSAVTDDIDVLGPDRQVRPVCVTVPTAFGSVASGRQFAPVKRATKGDRGRSNTSVGVPTCRIDPSAMTATRSASARAIVRSWVT